MPHLTESPDHAVRYLLALDAEMTEHLVAPDDVRRVDARHRELFVEGMADESRSTYREHNERAIRAIDSRADLLGLVEAYRRLKRDLGLVDFSDQIALAAPWPATVRRWVGWSARSSGWCCSTSTRTPPSPRPHAEPAVLGARG